MACHRGLRRLSQLLLIFAKKQQDSSNGYLILFLISTFLSIEAMFLFVSRFVFVGHLGV